MDPIQALLKDAKDHSIEYGSIPFWSWNDKLDEAELRRQIHVMQDLNMQGFFMHARGGLETAYLSDEWFDCINACIDEGKKCHMQAWSYDENGWPSGFAGGLLLKSPENHAKYLKLETSDTYAEEDTVLGVYIIRDHKLQKVTSGEAAGPYYLIRVCSDASLVDTFDKRVTEEFLALTYQTYKEHIPEGDFGTAMPGFFTDEPQYYRWGTVWSDVIPEFFQQEYGYSVYSGLPALFLDFEGAEVFRFDYWKLCHKLFMEHWVKPVYEWCDRNHCKLTGHAVEENTLVGQMWCCGGVMHFYEYEHIPGIDYLSRSIWDDVASKQLGSVCEQLGKKKALSEMFGCCGWDVTPLELKRIAERQYVNGVNLMCQHLYAYSIRGQRKRDYPANYSEHLTWQKEMPLFNQYFNHLGYLLSRGHEHVNTLVIHPIHSAYLHYKRDDDHSIDTLEQDFHELSDLLSQCHVLYHWGDESIMAESASVDGVKIRIGQCSYSNLIIPSFESMDGTTAQLVRQFLQNGGRVWCYGQIPSRIEGRLQDTSFLRSTVSWEEICRDSGIEILDEKGQPLPWMRVNCRDTEYGKFFYIVNLDDHPAKNVKIVLRGVPSVREVDVLTLEEKQAQGYSDGLVTTLYADFVPVGSHLYVEDSRAELKEPCRNIPQYISLDRDYTLSEIPENALTLDRFAVSFDNGKTFSEYRPIERIRDNLLRERYHGRLCLQAHFFVEELPESLSVVAEPISGMQLSVNDQLLTERNGWKFDRSFQNFDILPYVHIGENKCCLSFDYYQSEHVYHVLYGGVSESLRNCLNFDTEIECIYLCGKFKLDTPGTFTYGQHNTCLYNSDQFRVKRADCSAHPYNFVETGYPFFAGSMHLVFHYTYQNGMPSVLKLSGRYSVCRVLVNGTPSDTLMFHDEAELKPYLKEGDNEISLILTNSNRNLFGPHHGQEAEPLYVSTVTFSMENQWDGERCDAYVDRYAFVRFGFDC